MKRDLYQLILALEAGAKNAGDVFGTSHGIEMDGRDIMGKQIADLSDSPFRTYFINLFLVIAGFLSISFFVVSLRPIINYSVSD